MVGLFPGHGRALGSLGTLATGFAMAVARAVSLARPLVWCILQPLSDLNHVLESTTGRGPLIGIPREALLNEVTRWYVPGDWRGVAGRLFQGPKVNRCLGEHPHVAFVADVPSCHIWPRMVVRISPTMLMGCPAVHIHVRIPGISKVGENDAIVALLMRHQSVLRLEIAEDNSLFVQGHETLKNLNQVLKELILGQVPVKLLHCTL